MWANFEYFVRAVMPVAEDSGVTLSLHPNDPPAKSVGGVAQIFRDVEAFDRAIELCDSEAFGLTFCMGTWSSMGVDVIEALRHFGGQGKIVYVHFRDVQGSVPSFKECFLGEGNVNVAKAMKTLRDVGFHGFMIDDHVPLLVGDSTSAGPYEWGPHGRAFSTGYMSGLLEAVRQLA
jgi:mannonate dehydratase